MNLTKKQILSVLLAGPIGFCFGMALRMGLGSIERELEKYNNLVRVGTLARRGLQVTQNAAVIGLLLKTSAGKSILRNED